MTQTRKTDSGIVVVEKGPLVVPPQGLVVIIDPKPAPAAQIVDANGNPMSSDKA